jgi:hypothetical protein
MNMNQEDIDLVELTRDLETQFEHAPPEGLVAGRTEIRDAVLRRLGCSQLEAEELVDTLVLRGVLQLRESPEGLKLWWIDSARARRTSS